MWVPGDVDVVMHFASPASPADFERIPIQILKVGSLGTHNCLGLAKAKSARFFLASTSEVYGDPQVHPQPESYWGHVNPIGPRGVYDEAKRFAEAMTMAYHRAHGLDVRIVRIFNTFGPRLRVDDGRAVSNFLHQALLGKPITVYGDGSQTRSFCYVDDEVRGFLALLDGDVTGPVNIGNPAEYTVRQLAELVLEVTGSSSEIVYEPLPVDDPTQRQPDIALARERWAGSPASASGRASSTRRVVRRCPGLTDRRVCVAGDGRAIGHLAPAPAECQWPPARMWSTTALPGRVASGGRRGGVGPAEHELDDRVVAGCDQPGSRWNRRWNRTMLLSAGR